MVLPFLSRFLAPFLSLFFSSEGPVWCIVEVYVYESHVCGRTVRSRQFAFLNVRTRVRRGAKDRKKERERESYRGTCTQAHALNESQRPLSTVAFYLLHFLLCLLNGSSPFEPRFLLSFLFLSGSPFSSSMAGGGGAQGRIKRSRHPSRNRPTTHPRGRPMGLEDDRE